MLRASHRSRILAIVQAGGEGSRMDVLTRERAKPALPFAGEYQLIDFALSALSHGGVSDVWLGVQYQATSLARHVAGGRPWDLDRTQGGLQWLMPEQGGGPAALTGFSAGNADDLAGRADDIRRAGADAVVVLSADSVFSLDVRELVDVHLDSGASCTVVTVEGTAEQAAAKAALTVEDGVVTRVEYKAEDPSSTTIAAEIFVYDPAELVEALEELRRRHSETAQDEEHTGLGDFGETLLPHLVEGGRVHAFPMQGYWRDMGTPVDYLVGHRDLLDGRVDALDHPDRPVLSRFPELVPARVRAGAVVEDALLTAGCDVRGTVRRAVLGPGVVVEAGAIVEDSVVFAHTRVEADAHVATSVIDASCVVGAGARVGRSARGRDLTESELTLVGRDTHVAPGADLPAGSRLEPGTRA